jgi:hypothetical protein
MDKLKDLIRKSLSCRIYTLHVGRQEDKRPISDHRCNEGGEGQELHLINWAEKDRNIGKDDPRKVCEYIGIDKRGHKRELTVKFVFWGKATLYKSVNRRVSEYEEGI